MIDSTSTLKIIGAAAFVALVLGALGGYWIADTSPERIVNEIPVPVPTAREGEPGPPESIGEKIGEKIANRPVPATRREVASGGAIDDVAAFCGAAGFRAAPDSAAGRPSAPRDVDSEPIPVANLDGARILPRAQRYGDGTLTSWIARPNGDLARVLHEGVYDPSWYVDGDTLVVNSSRWHWADDVAKGGACGTAGVASGALFGLDNWIPYVTTGVACIAAWRFF